MSRLLSFFALILALVALSAPSASLGMGVTGPVWTVSKVDSAAPMTIQVTGCKSLGGKRVAPCHPDLGVLSTIGPVTVPVVRHAATRSRPAAPATILAPEAELPPPIAV